MHTGGFLGWTLGVEPFGERRQHGIHSLSLGVLSHCLCQAVAHLDRLGIMADSILHLAEQIEGKLSVGIVLYACLGIQNLKRRLYLFAAGEKEEK